MKLPIMFRIIFLLISLASLLGLLYGVLFIILDMEENSCRMTYMFEYPQFVRIHFDENKNFERYGLYSYSEGYLTHKARSMDFSGAPVIFIPGNGGSYKQARSLASVAIRKGIDNHWDQHLDYFSIDFNEEYSGLFGGYLENQKEFLKVCIKTVLDLYKKLPNAPRQVILIGHSMGGKIAESMLSDLEYFNFINSVISIASPIDRPVINLDVYFEAFYRNVENILHESRSVYVNNATNYCKKAQTFELTEPSVNKTLNNILFITIGGGVRDVLVHAGLTHSKYSDVHALATSIQNVWLSTDHLCSVWCLQLVLVINRFLYSIIAPSKSRHNFKSAQYFIEDKSIRSAKAHHFLVKPYPSSKNKEIVLVPSHYENIGDWVEDSRRVYTRNFNYGLNNTLVEMIRLVDAPQYKMLYAEVLNVDDDDWVFVCSAFEVKENMKYCSRATSLSHFIHKLPSMKHKRRFVKIDLHRIKRANSSWTHVLLRLMPTRDSISLHIDIHDPATRSVEIDMPKWYSFSEKYSLEDTMIGSSFYQLSILGLYESYQSLAIRLKPRSCSHLSYHIVAHVCVPWARGYDRYQYFTNEKNDWLYIYSPISKPSKYNTTENPILINLHLDPNCRYIISYKNSLGGTLSRIDHQYWHWIPAHITAILLLSLKYQISLTPKGFPFKCGKLHSALLSSSSFFIITATRIFAKFLLASENLTQPDSVNQSILISFIIHGASLAILTLIAAGLWFAITFYGNVAHTILLKLIRLPIPTISSVLLPIIEKFPITAGVLLASLGSASCGGIAMICACSIYFILITKQYEDYLEDYIHGTAKLIAKKLFGKFADKFLRNRRKTVANSRENECENSETDKETVTADNDEGVKQYEDVPGGDTNEAIKKECTETKEEMEGKLKTDEKKNENESIEKVEDEKAQDEKIKEKKKSNKEVENDDKLSEKNQQEGDSKEMEITSTTEETNEEEQRIEDEELDRLLKEAIEKQKQHHEEQKHKAMLERKEYDSVHESISSINFHMTMFLLLVVIALLNLPSTVSWAKNFKYSSNLSPDPSFIPSIIVIFSASILWQFSTPRNVYGYNFVSCILYISAAISVLFCQDSVYRLNGVISSVFLLVVIHQICSPRKPEEAKEKEEDDMFTKIENMKNLISGITSSSNDS